MDRQQGMLGRRIKASEVVAMAGIRVHVLDSRTIFAFALAEYLQGVPEVGEVTVLRRTSAAPMMLQEERDVVIADEVSAQRMRHELADARVLVLVDHEDVARITDLIAGGAAGICLTDEGVEAVAEGVTTLAGGGMRLPADFVKPVLEELLHWRSRATTAQQSLDQLTVREREVLELLAEGLGRAEIADRLTLSQHTVRTHVQHLLRKLSLHSQLEASALGRRLLQEAALERSMVVDLRTWSSEHSHGRGR